EKRRRFDLLNGRAPSLPILRTGTGPGGRRGASARGDRRSSQRKRRRDDVGLFTSSPALNSFQDLFVEQIQDLYDAEQRLVKALPKMAEAAHNAELKAAFQEHFRQTQNHVSRLEKVFSEVGKKAQPKTCEAMKGLVSEGDEMIGASGDPN